MAKTYKPIPLAQEEMPHDRVEETCCFCREKTTFWTDVMQRTEEQQVPCCEICADHFRQKDVPTKEYWLVVVSLLLLESAKSFRAGRKSMQEEAEKHSSQTKEDGNNAVAE